MITNAATIVSAEAAASAPSSPRGSGRRHRMRARPIAAPMKKNGYGQYLLSLLSEGAPRHT